MSLQIDTKGSEKVLGDHFAATVNLFGYPETQVRYVCIAETLSKSYFPKWS